MALSGALLGVGTGTAGSQSTRMHLAAATGCTRQTVENGTYPGRATLGVVTRGRPSGALARFLHWAHASPLAWRVIATHYVPG